MKRTTLAVIALALVPGIAAAQQDTTRTPADSARQQPATPQDSAAEQGNTPGRVVDQANEAGDTTKSALRDSLLRANQGGQQGEQGQVQSRGGRNTRNLGLSRSQVRELQTALNSTGCDAGSVDGIVGPRTRAALDCARSQKGISGDDNDALFQALNLNFAGGEASGRNVSPADTSAGGTVDTTRTTPPPAPTDSASGQPTTDTTTTPTTPPATPTPADTAHTPTDTTGTASDSARTRADSTRPPR